MKSRKRYLVAIPLMALLLLLGIVSLRWGFSSLDLWRAGEILEQLERHDISLDDKQSLLMRGYQHIASARSLGGGHADAYDRQGQFLYWQAMNLAEDWDERNRLLDEASEQYREALKVRPTWPYFWANLVVARAERGIFDGEFRKAVRRTVETGPWEPRVQLQLIRVDFIEQQRLDLRSRERIDDLLKRALRTQPLQVFRLADELEQLPRLCRMPEAEILANQCSAAGFRRLQTG